MRTVALFGLLLLAGAAVDVLRRRAPVADDASPAVVGGRRAGRPAASAPPHTAHAPPPLDLPASLAALCPSLASEGRRLVITSTLPRVALAVHPAGEQISDTLVSAGEWDGWGGEFILNAVRNASAGTPLDELVAIDAGANIGSLAVRWAAAGLSVHAFEATPSNADLLACSAALNGACVRSRVRLHRAALADRAGDRVCMAPMAANMGGSSVSAGGDDGAPCAGAVVETTTIDAHVAAHASSFADRHALLKIDVEGHEPALLLGAQATLASAALAPRVVTVEVSTARWEERFGASPADVLGLITAHGYRPIFPPEVAGAGLDALAAYAERERGGNPDVVFVK